MISFSAPIFQYRSYSDTIRDAIIRVLESGRYILGPEVEKFERTFATFCGAEHAVGVASGTDALILALKALGIGPGDEIITVSHTAVATVAAIVAAGATPVLVDVDQVYMTLDPAGAEAAITPRTKAILPVHLYGQPADLDSIVHVAKRRGLHIIEDCAQATGGVYHGRRLGVIGDVGCFSFYPTKNLGAIGDGGAVVTSDADIAARVRRLRQYGWDESRQALEIGINSRLDALQAAILLAKLTSLDRDNARRAYVAQRYHEGLAGLPIATVKVRENSAHAFNLYVVAGSDRDGLMAHLSRQNIVTAVHYAEPVHRQPTYAKYAILPEMGLPVTEQLCARILSLPIYPELSDDDIDRVISGVRGYFN